MLPSNTALDELHSPKDFAELIDLLSTRYQVDHEQVSLEQISLRPDGTLQTPAGEWRVTRQFLEGVAKAIELPLPYAYKIRPELFCENVAQRQVDAAKPITISRVGDVATGLIVDKATRYRPAHTVDVVQAIRRTLDLELRRASVSYEGVDIELAVPGRVVEPVRGDVIEVGVAVSNSESGGRQLKASSYSYRLVCTNGAVMADSFGLVRWPNDVRMTYAACLRAFEKGVVQLCESLEPVASSYQRAVDQRVPDDEFWNAWRRVAQHVPRTEADDVLGISETQRRDLQQLIRTRHPAEPVALTEHSAYDVHNRITHAAHGRTFRIRRALQEIGGDLLTRAAAWPPAASLN
jgi:Domain of unknown function (DUF932)